MDKQIVRTRFAPSPTGFLHVGGVRTALFAWLVARQANGQFILRIEDTDQAREVAGSEAHIIDSLKWLGLEWDEGPDKESGVRYRQSQRLDIYKQWGQKLIESGRAYADVRTPQQLDEIRNQAAAQKKPILFREHRLNNTPAWEPGMPLRFLSEPKNYTWNDEVLGELSTGPEVVDDFILIKSDGFPTYNFAHIVDDALMEISHVIRSQEFLSSVPKFLNLYEALGVERPLLATLPYVMAPGGRKKLSKRDGAKDVLDYKQEGYLPQALVNFLATLGWNDGTEQEIFSIEELKQKFSLSRVHKAGAHFDEQRLIWMNGQYIRQLSLDELYKQVNGYWGKGDETAEDKKKQVLELVHDRLKYFDELSELTSFFFEEPNREQIEQLLENPVDKKLKGLDKATLKDLLSAAGTVLEQSDFSHDDIANRLNRLLLEKQSKPGILFALVRVAVTGQASSPELFGTLHVINKEKSLLRLKNAIALLDSQA